MPSFSRSEPAKPHPRRVHHNTAAVDGTTHDAKDQAVPGAFRIKIPPGSNMQKARVFVSYARQDGEHFAANLVKRIEAEDIPVWRDRDGLRGGEGWWTQIEHIIQDVEFMVVVMTPAATQSEVVRKEWDLARRNGVCVFPVIASDDLAWSEMPTWMQKGHCYDLKHQAKKFFNDLNTRCEKLRVPFMVEALPENYVPRPAVLAKVTPLLMNEHRGGRKGITTVLRGAGGFGKTTLARAVCHDIRTQFVFHDGVLWVTLGQSPSNLAAKVEGLIYELSRERPGFTDVADASNRLRQLLEEKNVLIVIDDVWREADARPFLVGGAGCAWLMTTRNRDTLPADAEEISVDAMDRSEAIALLSAGLPTENDLSAASDMTALAVSLSEWPLLLSLVNRILIDRVKRRSERTSDALSYARTRFERQGLVAFDRRDAGKREEAVSITIAASLDQLKSVAASGEVSSDIGACDPLARFVELAVFPEDATIPVSTVSRFWGETAQIDDFASRELCNRFFDLSLLQSYDLQRQTIRLHDVVRSFVTKQTTAPAEARLHQMLLRSYCKPPGERWDEIEDDGYYYDHLTHHLIAAGRGNEIYELLNSGWRRAQFDRVGSDRAFAADVDTALGIAQKERPPDPFRIIQGSYICASLGTHAASVPPEVLGAISRMGHHERAVGYASLIHDPVQRTHAYCAIARALLERGEPAGVVEILDRASGSARTVDRLSPRSQVLSEVAEAYAVAQQVSAAQQTAELSARDARESKYQQSDDLLTAAHALLSCGLAAEAVQAAAEAMDRQGSDPVKALAQRLTAVDIYYRAGDAKRAEDLDATCRPLLDELNESSGAGLDHVPDLVGALIRRQDLNVAQAVAEKWTAAWAWHDVKSLAMIAHCRLDGGDTNGAQGVAKQLLAIIGKRLPTEPPPDDREASSEHTEPNDWGIFVDVVRLLARLDKNSDISYVVERIGDPYWQSAAYGVCAHAQASQRRDEAAGDLLARAFAAANGRSARSAEELDTAASVINALASHGNGDQALAAADLSAPLANMINPTDWMMVRALTAFASARAAIDPQRSIAIAQSFPRAKDRLDALAQVATGLAAGGHPELAAEAIDHGVALASNAQEHGESEHCMHLAQLALASCHGGAPGVADELLNRFEQCASGWLGTSNTTHMAMGLVLAVRALVELGELERAVAFANRISDGTAWELAKRIEAYEILVKGLMSKGLAGRARELATFAVDAAAQARVKCEQEGIFRNDLVAQVGAADALLASGDRPMAVSLAQDVLNRMSSLGLLGARQ